MWKYESSKMWKFGIMGGPTGIGGMDEVGENVKKWKCEKIEMWKCESVLSWAVPLESVG